MLVIYGTRNFGKIEACGGTYVVTRFFHIWFMPLVPLGSVLVVGEQGGETQGIPQPLDGRSMLLGYGRMWGILGALIGIVSGGGVLLESESVPEAVVGLLVIVVSLVVPIVSWVLGGTSVESRAHRHAYMDLVGMPVDVSRLPETDGLRGRCMQLMSDRAGALGLGYRDGANVLIDWASIASHPSVNDPHFLTAALTLARLEGRGASGAAKTSWETLHSRIWWKLRTVRPDLVQRARAS